MKHCRLKPSTYTVTVTETEVNYSPLNLLLASDSEAAHYSIQWG